jgi:uroporphyrinogen-III synthase
MTRILSTKKLLPNQKQFLLNAGLSVVDADFIEILNADFSLDAVKDNLVFTSANAVKAVANHPNVQEIRRKPCFCVGEKTAALLDEFGFTVVEIADEAAALGVVIEEKYKAESFTFFCGNIRLETLPGWFSEWNINHAEITVYQTRLTPVTVAETNGILFFSPSGVESFLSVNELIDQVCFCIGPTTAKALEKKTENIMIANKPSVENVIVQAINYYKK